MFMFCGTQNFMNIIALLFLFALLRLVVDHQRQNKTKFWIKTAHIKLYGVHSILRKETSSSTLLFEISLQVRAYRASLF